MRIELIAFQNPLLYGSVAFSNETGRKLHLSISARQMDSCNEQEEYNQAFHCLFSGA